MNLANRIIYAYKTVESTYRWLDITDIYLRITSSSESNMSLSPSTAQVSHNYLVIFMYFKSNNNTLIEAPRALAEATVKAIEEFYAKTPEEVLNISISVMVVDLPEYCSWSIHLKIHKVGEAIRCGKISGLDIVKIVYYYAEKPRELEVDTGLRSSRCPQT